MKKGFTIVELAIVLVIIGLLSGGILVGQSMIESVKVSRFASDLTQYSIAIANFKNKFRQEAGDSTYFNPQGNGDGDCKKETDAYDCGLYTGIQYVPKESIAAWAHLSQAQMLKEQFVFDQAKVTAGISKTVVPQTIDKGPLGFAFSQTGIRWRGSLTETYQRGLFFDTKPTILFALEKKLDDGVASINQGRITSYVWKLMNPGCTRSCFSQQAVCSATDTTCQTSVNFSPASNHELTLATD